MTILTCLLLVLMAQEYNINNFYLWTISLPGKNGTPRFDLSKDKEACVVSENLTPRQILLERVITKVFAHYSIPLDITDNIRSTFKVKLWRIGKLYSKLGTKNRKTQLQTWKDGQDAIWKFTVGEAEVNSQVLSRKRSIEDLETEITKRKCLEQKVEKLQSKIQQQAQIISIQPRKKYLRKPLGECSRQQKYNRKKEMIQQVQTSLSICHAEGYTPCSLEMESRDTGECEIISLESFDSQSTRGICKNKDEPTNDKMHTSLYVKDKFSISNQAYHELSIISDLPNLNEVKKLTKSMNSKFHIYNCPNNIIGVQHSLRERIVQRLTCFINKSIEEGVDIPNTIRIKLTGDGTKIGRAYNVVNIAFTMIDEGKKAQSVFGNYSVAILKIGESYDDLAAGLQDICNEAKELEVVTVQDKVYAIKYFLGGDLKFLAMVCGIEAANATHACVWCKCPKSMRSDMKKEWSLTNPEKGARTIDEIAEKCKLGKRNNNRFSCSRAPLFPFVPIEQVVMDTLHMFLRISDNLTNLLIRDLRIQDGLNKMADSTNLKTYETFLNEICKIRFKWNMDKESKELKYRDLTGPEKIRLFKNINIPSLFPSLPNKEKLQSLWVTFFKLVNTINEEHCDPDKIDVETKAWVNSFTSIYQSKDVTPYMHAFAMHTSQFIRLHGNIVSFTQQGLEKLNDVTTKYFQRSTNHHDLSSLRQILEKRNRIEVLQENGYERQVRRQVCSVCRLPGHNKKTCTKST